MRKFSGNEVQQKTRSFMNSQSWDYSFQNVPWRRELNYFAIVCRQKLSLDLFFICSGFSQEQDRW